jgi:hypothetical protein
MFTHNKQAHGGHTLKETLKLRLAGIDLLHPHFSDKQGNYQLANLEVDLPLGKH